MNKFVTIAVVGTLLVGSFGGAWAAATITGLDIVDGSIKSIDIGDKTVSNIDLATDAVDGTKIKNLSIKTGDLGDATVTSGKIKDATIQRNDIASGILPSGATNVVYGSCEVTDKVIPAQSWEGFSCPDRFVGLHINDHIVGSLKYTDDGGQQIILGPVNTNFDCDSDEDCKIGFMVYNPGLSDVTALGPRSEFDFVAWR